MTQSIFGWIEETRSAQLNTFRQKKIGLSLVLNSFYFKNNVDFQSVLLSDNNPRKKKKKKKTTLHPNHWETKRVSFTFQTIFVNDFFL